jgi:hypothetical protein
VAIAGVLVFNMACTRGPLLPKPVTETGGGSITSGTSASCSGGVFADTTRRRDIDHSGARGVMRLRPVEVDIDAVRRSAETRAPLTLNFFSDACLVVQVISVAHDDQGRLIWTGASEDVSVTIIAADDFVIGSAVSSRALYQVRYAGNGVHDVMQLNPAAFPPD